MLQNLANKDIKHVFVLMLENRSFDHMLGFLDYEGTDPKNQLPTRPEGVKPEFNNVHNGVPINVSNNADNIMGTDPGHEFEQVVEQLCGSGVGFPGGGPYPPINNSGFVDSFAPLVNKDPGQIVDVMRCYDPAHKLPVLATLAREFALCDHWFSSLPGPTWPNRFFVHAASSTGLDHSPSAIETLSHELFSGYRFRNGTIYDLFDRHFPGDKRWRLYRGRKRPRIGAVPCVAALKGIRIKDTHPFENFATDLKGVYPFAYTFIEPNYGDYILHKYTGGESQHPNDDVQNGERLIRSTYEAIRQSPLWLNSMLIISYDEHGGFFDHVPPPTAVAPGDTVPFSKHNQHGFNFEQYGVRVPAVVISPFTPRGTISHDHYDHASIPATLEAIFGMPSLTARDAAANNVTALAALTTARTDTPVDLKDIPIAQIAPAVESLPDDQARALEAITPVDGGNLPGFLHVVKKEDMQRRIDGLSIRPLEGALDQQAILKKAFDEQAFILAPFMTPIVTRAQARDYLESTLPGILDNE